MGKGKTAQRAARAARAAAAADTTPKFVTVKTYDTSLKPNGHHGFKVRWKKVPKEEWDRIWSKK